LLIVEVVNFFSERVIIIGIISQLTMLTSAHRINAEDYLMSLFLLVILMVVNKLINTKLVHIVLRF